MIVRAGKASLRSLRAVRKGRLETFVGGSYCPQQDFFYFTEALTSLLKPFS